jgi:hypothetical protein
LRAPDTGRLVSALEWVSRVRKQELQDFIAFCRQGGFAVCPQGRARHGLKTHGRATGEGAAALLDHENLDWEAAAAIIRPFLDG